jgi:hypothetical protein
MKMKRRMAILSAAALAFAMAGPVMAQQPHVTEQAVANADYAFFDSHPNIARQLEKNPSLIENQQYVDNHPQLHEYLKTHPYVRREFKDHPYRFMHRAEELQHH